HVLTFGVASFGQTFAERGHITHDGFWCCGVDKPDHGRGRLLRARRERPRGRSAAEQRYELAPFHVEHGGLPPLCGIGRRPTRALGFPAPSACHREAG